MWVCSLHLPSSTFVSSSHRCGCLCLHLTLLFSVNINVVVENFADQHTIIIFNILHPCAVCPHRSTSSHRHTHTHTRVQVHSVTTPVMNNVNHFWNADMKYRRLFGDQRKRRTGKRFQSLGDTWAIALFHSFLFYFVFAFIPCGNLLCNSRCSVSRPRHWHDSHYRPHSLSK